MEYNWTDVLQGIGSIASAIISIVGFWFIYLQIKQAKQAVIKQNNAAIYNLGVNLNSIILEYNHLKPYIEGEKEMSPSDPEYPKLITLIEMISDYYEYIVCERNSIDTKITEGWLTYLRTNIGKRKILRDFILNRRQFYSKEFIQEIKMIEKQVDSSTSPESSKG